MSEKSKAMVGIIRARQAGILAPFTEETFAKWHKRCADFRDTVSEDNFTGGAFVVGEHEAEEGMIPLICARGNATTLAAAVRGIILTWMAFGDAHGTPVSREEVAKAVADAIAQYESQKEQQ